MTAKDLYITFRKLGETKETSYNKTFSQGVFSLPELRELQLYYREEELSSKAS